MNSKILRSFNFFFIVMVFSGCNSYFNTTNYYYNSDYSINPKIPANVKIVFNFNTPEIKYSMHCFYSNFTKRIQHEITKDLLTNVFDGSSISSNPDLKIKIHILKFKYVTPPWGVLWMPLWLVGAPSDFFIGNCKLLVILSNSKNKQIGTYSSYVNLIKARGLYYNNKYDCKQKKSIMRQILKDAMEDIKKQIYLDRKKIIKCISDEIW